MISKDDLKKCGQLMAHWENTSKAFQLVGKSFRLGLDHDLEDIIYAHNRTLELFSRWKVLDITFHSNESKDLKKILDFLEAYMESFEDEDGPVVKCSLCHEYVSINSINLLDYVCIYCKSMKQNDSNH